MNAFGVVKEAGENVFIIKVNHEDNHLIQVKSNQIKCDFSLRKGDFLQLNYNKAQKLEEIEANLREDYEDQIRYIFDGYGIVGNETIFYFDDNDVVLSVGDTLTCDRVKGDYDFPESDGHAEADILFRCISFKKIESVANTVDVYSPSEQMKKDKGYTAYIEKPMKSNLRDTYEDISEEIKTLMTDVNGSENIRAKLDELIPSELNFSTYKKFFDCLIDLDEMNVRKEFEKYTKEDAAFHPKAVADDNIVSHVFTMEFEGLHELRPSILRGDKVIATHNETKNEFIGVVRRTLLDTMDIKFEEQFAEQFDEAATFTVNFFYSRNVYTKMHVGVKRAVERLGEDVLFPNGIGIANSVQLNAELDNGALKLNGIEVPWFKKDLDDSQKIAVVQALRAKFRPCPNLIHGPPGTGKTSTLIEIILHVFTQLKDSRILVAAHSNSAANLTLKRLLEHDFVKNDTVRLLSMAYQAKKSFPAELHPYCASLRLMGKDLDDVKEAENTETEMGIKIFRELECVAPFRIVIGTCVGLGPLMFARYGRLPDYSHVMVDEAGQCSEPEVMIPISLVDRNKGSVVLAGDPMQMPPLVLSNHAKERGLSKSLLERLIEQYKNIEEDLKSKDIESHVDLHLISNLLYNYRSLPSLLQFYSKHFYNNELKPTVSESDSPESKVLAKVQEIMPRNAKRNLKHAIYCHNIRGHNKQIKGSNSWFNSEENLAILSFIPRLLELGFASEDIGVITPYHLQVITLRKLFTDRQYPILVGSVDEFQGLERKVIVISTVRTDKNRVKLDIRRRLGIVADPKRTNVAISRARAVVVVFGRAEMLKNDKFWCALIEDCERNGTFYET